MDLGGLAWVVAVVLIAAVVLIVLLTVLRRNQADVDGRLGPLRLKTRTRPSGDASVTDSTSGRDVVAESTKGNASIDRVDAEGDIRARAGEDRQDPKAPENRGSTS